MAAWYENLMGCKAPRKRMMRPAKRREAVDPDLADLALAIAECRLDAGARGWFDMPWRDSWNAVALAADLAVADAEGLVAGLTEVDSEAIAFVRCAVQTRASDTETYHRADELLRLCAGNVLVAAALRCLQITMSHSDGGGEIPSVVLRLAYERTCVPGSHESYVMEHRCQDAIGTTPGMRSDRDDRIRRAFAIAWNRAMFRACYALPNVSQRGAKA